MSKNIVRFSRLLKFFNMLDSNIFIVELEENNQKNIYVSNEDSFALIFKNYNGEVIKEEIEVGDEIYHLNESFSDSSKCLLSECDDLLGLLSHSHVTHFEGDCSSADCADYMFAESSLEYIKATFPLLEWGSCMFAETPIKEVNIDFPKLKYADNMFIDSKIEKFTGNFPALTSGLGMFEGTPLKEFNGTISEEADTASMFEEAPREFLEKNPHFLN